MDSRIAPQDEQHWVRMAQQGDRESLGKLLLHYHSRLVRRLTHRMPPEATRTIDPEDIAQRAHIAAYRDVAHFEYQGSESFFAWLSKIADRQMLNALKELRTQKRGGHVKTLDRQAVAASARDLLANLAGDVSSPSLNLRRAELVDALHVALSSLPEDYRQVITFRFLHNMTIQETSEAMGRTPAAVRSLATRAKSQLREMLVKLSVRLTSR